MATFDYNLGSVTSGGDVNDKDSEIDSLKEEIENLDCPNKIYKRLMNERSFCK